MTNKKKLIFTGGLAIAVVGHVLKHKGKTENIRKAAKIAVPIGLVLSAIVLLSNVD